jgi:hypothetical protein
VALEGKQMSPKSHSLCVDARAGIQAGLPPETTFLLPKERGLCVVFVEKSRRG